MIERGMKHLIYEIRTTVTYELFSEMVHVGIPGLCLTTTAPQRLSKEYKMPEAKIYLVSECENIKGVIHPKSLEGRMMDVIQRFVKEHHESIVLIDDIEYLIMENGYEQVEKFVAKVGKLTKEKNSTLLVPINPNSMRDNVVKAMTAKFDDVRDVRNILVTGDKIECPECGAMWPATTKLCDICSYNFEKPASAKPKPASAQPPQPEKPAPKPEPKRTERAVPSGSQAEEPKRVEVHHAAAPMTGDNWFNRGVALEKMGRSEEAVECFDKAILDRPDDSWAWFNKGVSLHRMGIMGEAMKCYDRALAIEPNDPDVLSNKGIALRSLGKTEEAIECYLTALKYAPKDAGIWSNLGVTYRVLGRTKDALDCYARALAINPNDVSVLLNKAAALQSDGHQAEALESYKTVLALEPNNPVALRNMRLIQ
jgi:tetratricopeptide (TPR) repeat protein